MRNNIRIMRALRNLTQWQLAQATGLSQSTLSQVENGLVVPKYKALEKIAEALGTPVENLLCELKVERVSENVDED